MNRAALAWLFVCVGYAAPSRADDTVFLRSGGRARGTVIEEDRVRGVTVALPNGAFRTFTAAEVKGVEYGAAAPPASPQSTPPSAPALVQPKAAAPIPPPTAASAAVVPISTSAYGLTGTLRVESTEPGKLLIDGAEYGLLPQVVPQLSAGPHRVVVQFSVGDSVSRMVGVRAGEETLATFESTPSLEVFKVQKGWHFGLGGAFGAGLVDGNDWAVIPRVFARASFAATRVVTFRGDLVLGGYPGERYADGYTTAGTSFGATLRLDLQLNWGSIYTLDFGVDFGFAAHEDDPLVGGAHGSVLGFRFGENREFLLSAQEGFVSSGGDPVFEQTFELSYLFF